MRNLLLLTAALLLPLPLHAAADQAPQLLLKRVQSFFIAANPHQRINDISGKFRQQARIASLNRSRTGHGTMQIMFQRQNGAEQTLFCWNYLKPSRQQVICDGETLWVYMPENNQVMVSAVTDKSYYKEDPLLFLRNLGHLDKHFSVEWAAKRRDQHGNYVLALTPLKASVYIKTLELAVPAWINNRSARLRFPIAAATIIDPTDNVTSIEFSDIRINNGLTPQQFKFDIPAGVAVVHPADLRRQ